MGGGDDLTLLARAAQNGDDRALAELVGATQDAVVRLCAHLCSAGEAEDLAQETYLRALQALPRFRFEAPVRAWLLAIARHVCVDHVRRRMRRAPIDRRLAVGPTALQESPAIELRELVATLDLERRTAFVLTQLLGLSYEEAAVACECPVGTIRSRVARARAHLAAAVREAEAG